MRRWVLGTIGIAVLILAIGSILGATMFFRQESLVFFPDRIVPATPAHLGMAFEEVRLRASDGPSLHAWWIPAEKPRGALILCHGNAGNMAHRIDKAVLFREMGLSVLLFDYRGYGTSEGAPSEEGTYRDMDAAVEYVQKVRGVPPSATLFWGESLGAAVALESAMRHPCSGLILESGFTSLPDMARAVYPLVPAFLVRMRYESLRRIGGLTVPVLILHGPADEIVPYSMGRELFAAAPRTKRFSDLRGGHNDGGILVSPEAQRALGNFLDETLGGMLEER